MTLPAPNLDDRHFQDIVDEAKRLIPRYCPEWTNHNLSDPGVALIELFAWMSEMILFRLNQVPDRLYTKFLDLVGIEPFPPSVARVDLTFWLSAVLDTNVVVPAGTEVTTAIGAATGEDVVFSTTEDLPIGPPDLFAAKTGTASNDQLLVDAWDDLRFPGSEVVCFTTAPLTPGDAVYLGFRHTLGGNLLRLSVSASIEGIGVDPNNPPIVWEAWSGEAWLHAPVQLDTTGGLNRDGQILLQVPRTMGALSLGGTSAYWLRCRLIPARDGQAPYQTSPRLASVTADVLGGTASAEHASAMPGESLGRSVGAPGQTFVVGRPPVLPRAEGEVIRVVTTDRAEDWLEVSDFTASKPGDAHYILDDATGTVTFGPAVRYPDGTVRQHGAIPPDGAEILITGYRHGGGAAGNVGAGTLNVLRSSLAYIDRVTNLEPAIGGVDAETPANAKLRGPLTLRTGQRAVTARDFERLTLEASTEVARVRCLSPSEPAAPVRLLVVPQLRRRPMDQQLDDFALSDPLVARITSHLEPRRMLGTTVEIGTPYYQGVTVAALLTSLAGRPAELVRQRALEALYRYINPLSGGTNAEGWPFDTDLNASPLAELLEAVEGVERVEEVLLFEYDLRTGQRHGVGREMIHLDRQSLFLSARHQVVVR
ncbi:putative baseplate assembly protein [Acidiferrimicrobium sp. IK]|uniref:putative baseplate assembly protein n=1 Tax=Acidiferrimicrobium sp. IK TaxID=2871700 RepID=UPI0021CB841E|nr:putative baseplate assembly protein [Acidiferrimicrobium sp. IK]MCU4186050.1 putative baseplate assembly protein [Acidiferrimicrobium sp. IK]